MSAFINKDKIVCDNLWAVNWLPRFTPWHLLSCDHHVIIMWLFGPIRTRLTFCGHPHVSMSSSSMLITATKCRCLQIWIQECAMLKQSQLQHSWQSSPLHINGFSFRDTESRLTKCKLVPLLTITCWRYSKSQICYKKKKKKEEEEKRHIHENKLLKKERSKLKKHEASNKCIKWC